MSLSGYNNFVFIKKLALAPSISNQQLPALIGSHWLYLGYAPTCSGLDWLQPCIQF